MWKKHVLAALGVMLAVAPVFTAHAGLKGFLGNMKSDRGSGTAIGRPELREPVYRTYQTRSTNKCLDATGTTNGSPVVQWDCWADVNRGFNQKWHVTTFKSGYSIVQPQHTDKCLDATGGENGSPVVQWDCWGGANQEWKRVEVGDGAHYFVNKQYGKCLDATGSDNGSPVVLWDCWGGENQKWYGPRPKGQANEAAKTAFDVIGITAHGVGIFGGSPKF